MGYKYILKQILFINCFNNNADKFTSFRNKFLIFFKNI